MIVVADSGSTKADWKILKKDASHSFSTMGFNPVFHSDEIIFDALSKSIEDEYQVQQADTVYYYGSGCWDAKRKDVVARALKKVFVNAEIKVDHDLLAAARATCGNQPGIACILGTGSNSCLYDGTHITDNVTNLGFLIGDEGSGTHIGKKLIRAYFYRELPKDLLEKMDQLVPGGKSEILDNVYEKGSPNVYMASFTRFMSQNIEHPVVQKMLYESFATFIDRNVRKYKNHISLPVHFIGSVAYHFRQIIQYVLDERAMITGNFIQKPIDHLVNFHSTEL
jgi:N-acetylglucosamine kinase-like BadF-type ATPase